MFYLSSAVSAGTGQGFYIGREGGPEGLEAYLETKAVFMPGP
ncbi:hypothetical protein PV410_41180 [Streptomyces sp. PA03-5A]|nr:hypothetical protein [Streptomyces sp. PA03-5A]